MFYTHATWFLDPFYFATFKEGMVVKQDRVVHETLVQCYCSLSTFYNLLKRLEGKAAGVCHWQFKLKEK